MVTKLSQNGKHMNTIIYKYIYIYLCTYILVGGGVMEVGQRMTTQGMFYYCLTCGAHALYAFNLGVKTNTNIVESYLYGAGVLASCMASGTVD